MSIHFLSRICFVLDDEQVVEGLLGCALAFDGLAKANYFRLRVRGFLFVVIVLLVDQVCGHFVQAIRHSDPRMRIVFVHRFNSNF